MIEAANRIRHRPYRWGGGHRDWSSRGYDCSGSVSWVRIYANREHVFAVIAGLRWDTSMTDDGDRTGPGWSEYLRSGHGFRLRHPVGLLQARPTSLAATAGTSPLSDPCTWVQRHLRAASTRLFWLF